MKLRQSILLFCKSGKISDPAEFLTNTREIKLDLGTGLDLMAASCMILCLRIKQTMGKGGISQAQSYSGFYQNYKRIRLKESVS